MADPAIARVYDEPSPQDGLRVLVDRLWPRGMRRSDARVEEWIPHVAPSTSLRRWYGHRPERADEFHRRYLQELGSDDESREALRRLRELVSAGPVTLLTATRDVTLSHLPVLVGVLTNRS